MRKALAALFVVLGVSGVIAAAPAASADPILKYATEGEVDPDRIGASENLICVNPHIKVFGNVLLEDPICL